ncbi:MAG TPA: SDR family oxidoreductase [Chitinophagales bacterium]|nr:SDR family oxidoreductase [Chitinophagales bacterium]
MSYALITGASKGIGKAFAESLAKRQIDLLLVARTDSLLQQLSDDLKNKYGVRAQYLALDLSQQDSAQKIFQWVDENNFDVQILINNAGYALWGNFIELSLQEQNEMIAVNIFTMINLTHLLIPKLMLQNRAYILNLSSSAAYQAVPTITLYAAAKSFVLSFSRGLRRELNSTPISVTCLSPGPTKTNFVERARMFHMQKLSDKMSMSPEDVAEFGIKGMLAGKAEIIPGFTNQAGAFMARIAPKNLVEKVAGGLYVKKEKRKK